MSLGFDNARHLLSRTSFGGDLNTVEAYANHTNAKAAVRALLKTARTQPFRPPPRWLNEPPPTRKERRANPKTFRKQSRERALEIKNGWYTEMIATSAPLTEQMTLFWHNHFTSSLRKVRFSTLIYRQHALLRQHALGSFRDMLHAIARDPAMLLYLDGQTNRKRKPNENFARELLELFTLGEGHYSEQDIREAARAFTGWKVQRKTGQFQEVERNHDSGLKTFLGRKGHFRGGDIIDILLEQPRTAEYITTRLWRAFVSPQPDPKVIGRIARIFRSSNYNIAPTMEALLSSKAFFAPNNRGTMIKSPVELMVGTMRAFKLSQPESPRHFVRLGRALGQDIFNPPNVKGWPGHEDWITTHTLLLRHRILAGFVRKAADALGGRNAKLFAHWLGRPNMDAERAVTLTTRLLLPIEPVHSRPNNADAARILQHLLLDPAYQLK